jgi:phenylacetic acid degradation protein paaN
MNTTSSNLFTKHSNLLNEATKALFDRNYYTPYPEHPKAYDEAMAQNGLNQYEQLLNTHFQVGNLNATFMTSEEASPYTGEKLGISYPSHSVDEYITKSNQAAADWQKLSPNERAGILAEMLERVKNCFFEIAHATVHTTGQSFMMSFQASGPHANDRALETIVMGLAELNRFPSEKSWVKPMGKFDLTIQKNWKAIPKGINLIIGCSTFPTWNTVPGLFAGLITGNTAIVKPHPKAILPIAIVIREMRAVLSETGLNPDIVQLAPDTLAKPITKDLAEHPAVKLIDYTGGSAFGDYIETLNKTVFTEKAGVNSVIIDSVTDIKAVAQNIAFSACLYSGQMCTAPQNIFIPNEVQTSEGVLSFEQVADSIKNAVEGIVTHPKMGAGTLGAIQNEQTLARISNKGDFGGIVLLDSMPIDNEEFANARVHSPKIVSLTAEQKETFSEECFGPVIFLIKTNDTAHAISLAEEMAESKGAITCLAFSTNDTVKQEIEYRMNAVFTPVSFNLNGAAFVNQHAAFSDFHVTGGNPAGNASFTNPEYVNRRFVWVGNRFM